MGTYDYEINREELLEEMMWGLGVLFSFFCREKEGE